MKTNIKSFGLAIITAVILLNEAEASFLDNLKNTLEQYNQALNKNNSQQDSQNIQSQDINNEQETFVIPEFTSLSEKEKWIKEQQESNQKAIHAFLVRISEVGRNSIVSINDNKQSIDGKYKKLKSLNDDDMQQLNQLNNDYSLLYERSNYLGQADMLPYNYHNNQDELGFILPKHLSEDIQSKKGLFLSQKGTIEYILPVEAMNEGFSEENYAQYLNDAYSNIENAKMNRNQLVHELEANILSDPENPYGAAPVAWAIASTAEGEEYLEYCIADDDGKRYCYPENFSPEERVILEKAISKYEKRLATNRSKQTNIKNKKNVTAQGAKQQQRLKKLY